jgi:hypothetical protein
MNLQPANQQPMQLVPILQQHPPQQFHGQFVQSFPQGPLQGSQSFTLAPAVPQQGTLWSVPQPPAHFAVHNSIPIGATVVQQAPQQPQQQPAPNWALPGVVHHPQRGGPGNNQSGMAPLAPIQPSATSAPNNNANLSGEDLNNYTNLFVAPLPKSVRNDDLLRMFAAFRASHASVMMDVYTGRSKGFGFVTFETPEDGFNAARALQGSSFVSPLGESFTINISASHHKKSSSLNESRHVYFRNLPTALTHEEIRIALAKFGDVVSLSVKLDNQHRWLLASVEYRTVEQAKNAVEMGHGKVLFPAHSTFPVMTKFADNQATKAARRERRERVETVVMPKLPVLLTTPLGSAESATPVAMSVGYPKSTPPESTPSLQSVEGEFDADGEGDNEIQTIVPLPTQTVHQPNVHTAPPAAPRVDGHSHSAHSRSSSSIDHETGTDTDTDTESCTSTTGSSGRYRRNPYSADRVTVDIEDASPVPVPGKKGMASTSRPTTPSH